MKVLLVFGARPNFMKIAPIFREMKDHADFSPHLLHTGQHFDPEMSDDFFKALEMPIPDIHLGVGGGSLTWQTAEVMQKIEPVIQSLSPDLTIVVGDVNSTVAAAFASAACQVPVAHVEAGLRSRDWAMPEERNRVITDRLSRYLFTPSEDAAPNLLAEGIAEERIYFVGNVMIDSLDWMLPRIDHAAIRDRLGLTEQFGLVTIHRPSNVDDAATLERLLLTLEEISHRLKIAFPIHPRTRQRLEDFGLTIRGTGIETLPPLGYPEFLSLMSSARLILTDSGGIQEEAMVLGTPCITLRENTERPITLSGGNELAGSDPERILAAVSRRLADDGTGEGIRPRFWDGRAGCRIVKVLASNLDSSLSEFEKTASPI